MANWQLQDAEARLREMIELAQTDGPQMISWRGKTRAVLVSIEWFEALQSEKDFKKYLLSGPKVDDLTIDRPRDLGWEVDL